MVNTNKKKRRRVPIGLNYRDVVALPDLIDIQLVSFERFLQYETLKAGLPPIKQGLEEVFQSTFPIESPNGDIKLFYEGYYLDEKQARLDEYECKRKGQTYSIPLRAHISLQFETTGEIRQKDVYIGDIPLMTDRGTFIINGSERVVVSQIHRSPGVVFAQEKGVLFARINPAKGSWLEFEIESKKDLLYVKIDRKKRILGTIFLRALGYDSREKIIDLFYKKESLLLPEDKEARSSLGDLYLARAVYDTDGSKIFRAGQKLRSYDLETLYQKDIKTIEVIVLNIPTTEEEKREESDWIHSPIILNCFEREDSLFINHDQDEPDKNSAIRAVYSILQPSDSLSVENAEKDLHSMFFSKRRYDLGAVGRYKLDKKFRRKESGDTVLSLDDIVQAMIFLVQVDEGVEKVDDIDHLGNRRVRSVGEMLSNIFKTAFLRMERIAKERMSSRDNEGFKPQDIISVKPVVAAIKEFFGSSQLSQFMDQVNPLAELTHKRRLNALGPGGLSRDRAGFEVRDVHYSHYGRMCPIETPEGPNIGLIASLASYTRINEYGFLETPYRKVIDGKATDEVVYLSAIEEEHNYIAQANSPIDNKGDFLENTVSVRCSGDYTTQVPERINYMDVSPKQIISVSSSLIPFLEHDDANRALMGSNMQRQSVPLLFPESPIVGTGMETKIAYDSGVVVKTKRAGEVIYVTSTKAIIRPEHPKDENDVDEYRFIKVQRTNQDTCFHQRPIVKAGQKVERGQVIADGPSTDEGELALGRNLIVGFVPWNGYNYEDAILISERVVKEDVFTSIHIKEFSVEVRDTKLGMEKLTNDIPNLSDYMLRNLDEEGIIRIGAKVSSGDILVGKITPKSENDASPEFKLLSQIFGDKAKDVKDNSLRVPHGIEGTVVDIQRLTKEDGADLPSSVEEVVKVFIAKKSKLKEGDKMAGRHGNKGVVARILPEADMPYMADGTPLDVCLNPLGVPSRMNLGQLMESQLGLAGLYLNENYASSVFQSASNDQIQEKLVEAGFSSTSKMTLYDGYTGEPLENPVMVGVMYVLKLHHLVDDKMHARSTGPYSLVTQQPLGGKAHFGGQRLGEMEVWALEAYGASHVLQELLTVKSDDMAGRTKIYESIVKGEPMTVAGVPESFNVLVQELRSLVLDLSMYDAKGKQIPLTERDEELINRRESQF